ncbi:DUF6056 family protein [Entomobacter blattae]|uniref:Uncharacterized protein n=1 Tax=Entomobacter blattae TaxID=2762277 RepID=A0A7H1NQ40_9PROT|nr:DUF6056 family protein [Entomobacter blattae]QNT77900.1 hypothetical protein JGUZn3_06580 [Entomobacter blattae]
MSRFSPFSLFSRSPSLHRPFILGEGAALTLCFFFTLWANMMTPLWGDDYCFTAPLNLTDYASTTWQRYWTWTGRLPPTFLTFLFLGLGQASSLIGFHILNAALFTGLLLIISRFCFLASHTQPSKRFIDGFSTTLLIMMALWWLSRSIGEVVLWKTGAINYLWAVSGEFGLLFFVISFCLRPSTQAFSLKRTAISHRGKLFIVKSLLTFALFLAAFIVAMFLEPLSLLFSFFYSVLFLKKNNRKAPYFLSIFLGHWAGSLVLLTAPGNFARKASLPPSPIWDRIDGLLGFTGSLFDPYWLGVIALAILVFLYRHTQKRLTWGEILTTHKGWIFGACAIVYLLLLLALPRSALASRVSFPASLFLICYLLSVLYGLLQQPDQNQQVTFPLPLSIVICLLWGGHLYQSQKDINETARFHKNLILSLHLAQANMQAHTQTNNDVTLPDQTIGPRHKRLLFRKDKVFMGLSPDPEHWINRCFAKVYTLHSIKVSSPKQSSPLP